MKLGARLISLILTFILFLLAVPAFLPPAQAQSLPNDWTGTRGFGEARDASRLSGAMNFQSYRGSGVQVDMKEVQCLILPDFGSNGCTNNDQIYQSMLRNSAIGIVSSQLAFIYSTPPADLALWGEDVAQTLGFLPKKAYAQGVGFSGLAALLPVWKAFRNIAYLILAIMMIVVGFMVMLRKRIDPKTVVTVQNAIPRIVMTLIIITFSYAIVGIMVDLMYLAILLAVGVFESSGLLPDLNTLILANPLAAGYGSNRSLYTQGGIFSVLDNVFTGGVIDPNRRTGLLDLTLKIFGMDNNFWRILQVAGIIGGLAALPALPIVGIPLLAAASFTSIVGLLVGIALLFLVIRLFIFFFSSYLQVIFALIFGPIQLVMDALPGSTAFSTWFKNLVANLVVFPIGAVIFMLSAIFANLSSQSGTLWTPPYLPVFSASITSVAALVSIGILFTIPTIAGGIKEALKAKPFVQAGPEGIAASLGQPFSLLMQMYQFYVSHETMKAFRRLPGGGKEER